MSHWMAGCCPCNVYLVVVVTSCCGAYRSCGWNVGVASCYVCQRFNVYLVVVVTSCCGAYRSCGWNVGVASC